MNMRRIAATLDKLSKACLELREKDKKGPTFTCISRIIKGDRSWIYGYDPETKQQSSQWKRPQSPRARKAWQVRSSTKSMLIVFFDVKGIAHHEFVPPNTAVNSHLYSDVLRCFRENMRRKRPKLWRDNNWLLHQDNAPAHTSLKTTEIVTNNHLVIVPHPPYSLCLAPCDVSLFRKLKMKLKGRRFETVSDVQREFQVVLDTIKENDFHSAFEAWKKRWDRCICSKKTILKEMAAEIE
jgi:histone-lysine N-methyltransferase SETMAR